MPWRESAAELERARSERPVVIEAPGGALYGIFTPPGPQAPSSGLCAVLLTRPRSHRNRMWIEGARRLGARGFACFRFDYHGTGDSEGEAGYLDPNQPYRDDVVAVMRHLRDHLGQRRFVLYGSCFDARTALSAFLDEAEAIEGLAFVAAPVMELKTMVKVDADRRSWGHLARALLRSENWKAMLRPERWQYVATVLGRMARRSVAGRPEEELPLAASFLEHFRQLVNSRARALFLYGEEDPEYQSFRVAERRLFSRLPVQTQRRFTVEVWPGVVHSGFVEMGRQRETFERVMRWIESLHPMAAAEPAAPGSNGAHPAAGHVGPEAAWTSN